MQTIELSGSNWWYLIAINQHIIKQKIIGHTRDIETNLKGIIPIQREILKFKRYFYITSYSQFIKHKNLLILFYASVWVLKVRRAGLLKEYTCQSKSQLWPCFISDVWSASEVSSIAWFNSYILTRYTLFF